MNKVVTVSISGIVCTIEEIAYTVLKSYLDRLKVHFTGTEGRDEILSDIESRIAEMLQEALKGRNVVEEKDINQVIAAMGNPEEMAEGEKSGTGPGAEPVEDTTRKYERRVFRDPDGQIIGGVCGGIANYFGFDPLLLRLGFVVAFFGFGTGLLLYLILWIIIPKAKTASERLQMKGERIDVSNIEKTVKDKLDSFGQEVKDLGKNGGSRVGSFLSQLWQGLAPLLRGLGRIAALLIAAISLALVVAMVGATLGIAGVLPASYPDFVNDIFDSREQMTLSMAGIGLLIGVPFLALLYYSLRFLLNIKRPRNRWVGGTFLGLWLAGIAIVISQGVKAGSKFRAEEGIVEEIFLARPTSDTLYLTCNNPISNMHYPSNQRNHQKGCIRMQINNEDNPYRVWLNIRQAQDKEFKLIKDLSARGGSRQEAYSNAMNIKYSYKQEDNELKFDGAFSCGKERKWRAQELELTLEVPVGKVMVMKRGMESMIYDIPNEQDILDFDMIGYHWLMTERGLTCLDCPGEKISTPIRHVSLVIL